MPYIFSQSQNVGIKKWLGHLAGSFRQVANNL
jgi:hypothetical protein